MWIKKEKLVIKQLQLKLCLNLFIFQCFTAGVCFINCYDRDEKWNTHKVETCPRSCSQKRLEGKNASRKVQMWTCVHVNELGLRAGVLWDRNLWRWSVVWLEMGSKLLCDGGLVKRCGWVESAETFPAVLFAPVGAESR